jgi:hypothetical protein
MTRRPPRTDRGLRATALVLIGLGWWSSPVSASPHPWVDGATGGAVQGAAPHPVVDTNQAVCYDTVRPGACPDAGRPFHGQDAQYAGVQPGYVDNGDGTITDLVTGLEWQKDPGAKVAFAQARSGAGALRLGGHDDWRLPTIKELYSLIEFSGTDPSGMNAGTSGLVPFLDTAFFVFQYGDTRAGERVIDAQYWSSTSYVSTTMNGNATVFGVNFADGRIKGYPRDRGPRGGAATEFARYVRGDAGYGENDLVDNGDGTVTDRATGLMWLQTDNGRGLDWQAALSYAEGLAFAGHDDWRLPNAKELQGIVDYTRSPDTSSSAAIDPLFACTAITNEAGQGDYPSYWTGTTHASSDGRGAAAAYVAFGRAMGYMNGAWIDVHGAGAQRSDPKAGNPAAFPQGRGPQGDAIRIYNYVRAVRDAGVTVPTPTDTQAPPPTATETASPTSAPPTPWSSDTVTPSATAPPTPTPSALRLFVPWTGRRAPAR